MIAPAAGTGRRAEKDLNIPGEAIVRKVRKQAWPFLNQRSFLLSKGRA
jgi:hypothetical protein